MSTSFFDIAGNVILKSDLHHGCKAFLFIFYVIVIIYLYFYEGFWFGFCVFMYIKEVIDLI